MELRGGKSFGEICGTWKHSELGTHHLCPAASFILHSTRDRDFCPRRMERDPGLFIKPRHRQLGTALDLKLLTDLDQMLHFPTEIIIRAAWLPLLSSGWWGNWEHADRPNNKPFRPYLALLKGQACGSGSRRGIPPGLQCNTLGRDDIKGDETGMPDFITEPSGDMGWEWSHQQNTEDGGHGLDAEDVIITVPPQIISRFVLCSYGV